MHSSCLLFICCFIGLSLAATWLEIQRPPPGEAPYCVDHTGGRRKIGEEWQEPGNCVRHICSAGSEGTVVIDSSSCGTVAAEPPCKVVTPNGTKPYPECCPMPVC